MTRKTDSDGEFHPRPTDDGEMNVDVVVSRPWRAEPDRARSFRTSPASASFKLELTKREAEVLQLIADGLLNKQIAQRLYLSPETIKSCVDGIRMKLDATNRAHAASIGVRCGLID
jgi:DNA-binding NarL/FixJ family response regulator